MTALRQHVQLATLGWQPLSSIPFLIPKQDACKDSPPWQPKELCFPFYTNSCCEARTPFSTFHSIGITTSLPRLHLRVLLEHANDSRWCSFIYLFLQCTTPALPFRFYGFWCGSWCRSWCGPWYSDALAC